MLYLKKAISKMGNDYWTVVIACGGRVVYTNIEPLNVYRIAKRKKAEMPEAYGYYKVTEEGVGEWVAEI